ncbi:MAG TPA: hypothetical protein VMJ64_00785, partial [Anaerolineales bacterium]|nr:hypothetical protein [Anaerolineales bacterium]
MAIFVLAGILLPFVGSILILAIPRSWVKWAAQAVALMAAVCTLYVLADFAAKGKAAYTADILWLGNILLYGVVVDKVSTLISTAFVLFGLLTLIYSGGYLTAQNREHAEHEVNRRYYFFLLVFIGSMAGLVMSSTM